MFVSSFIRTNACYGTRLTRPRDTRIPWRSYYTVADTKENRPYVKLLQRQCKLAHAELDSCGIVTVCLFHFEVLRNIVQMIVIG